MAINIINLPGYVCLGDEDTQLLECSNDYSGITELAEFTDVRRADWLAIIIQWSPTTPPQISVAGHMRLP